MISQKEADRIGRRAADRAVTAHLKELNLDPDELSEDQEQECNEIYAKEIDACGADYEDYCEGLGEDRRIAERERRKL